MTTRRKLTIGMFSCPELEMLVLMIAIFMHLELAWARAIVWWLEIGCSVRSLPALYGQAIGMTDAVGHVLSIVMAMSVPAVCVVATNGRPSR